MCDWAFAFDIYNLLMERRDFSEHSVYIEAFLASRMAKRKTMASKVVK
jgi:hypothetical protein